MCDQHVVTLVSPCVFVCSSGMNVVINICNFSKSTRVSL